MATKTASSPKSTGKKNKRANDLADRLERGAQALISLANSLSDAEWKTPVGPRDGRKVGVIVHHVATVYPIEISLAQTLAQGKPVVGVTMEDIHAMNANHAQENDGVTKQQAVELLKKNSQAAAAAIRELSDEELDSAAPASLYFEAPITAQFMLEDHAVRHSYHHLSRIRVTLRK